MTGKPPIAPGSLLHRGQPFVAVGVNYHPSAAGCELLRDAWDPAGLAADFGEMAARGCNTVRFFVFWRDLEPAPGEYDEVAIDRLRRLVSLAGDAGLACVPALLTIFMNGELLDLPWRGDRDPWTDPSLRRHAREYVNRVASELRSSGNVLAYDLGDELLHIAPQAAGGLTREEAAQWLAELADAVREGDPAALVTQGNESSAVFGDHPFGVDNAEPLDLLALHGFPLWSPAAIESTLSYKATLLPAFLARFGSLFGSTLIDELGAYAVSPEVAAHYLRAAGHSALANGAIGLLAWCWQDIESERPPYDACPQERLVGLLDGRGRPKPAMAELERLASGAAEWASLAPPPAPVAIFVPELWRPSHRSYIARQDGWALAAFYAFLLLKRAHLPVEFAARPQPHHRLLVCPSVERLTLRDHAALAGFVAAGGDVLCSSGTVLHGLGEESLFGVRPHDFTLDASQQAGFEWRGVELPIDWGSGAQVPVLEATGAEVLARYPNGHPALTRKAHGDGAALYLNAPFERQLDVPGRLEAHPWHDIYAALATGAGIEREVDCDSPQVELQVMVDGVRRVAFAINHAPQPVSATVTLGSATERLAKRIDFEPKAVEILRWEVPPASGGDGG